MDINNAFYKRINYKKNSYSDIKSYIKFYHVNKNILFLTNKNDDQSNFIITQITETGNAFRYCILKDLISKSDFRELLSKSKTCQLIIAYGDDYLANLTKILATANNCEYVLCPSKLNSLSYFTKFYTEMNSNVFKETTFPSKIFIDEKVIKTLPLSESIVGLKEFCSYFEYLFTMAFENKVTEENNYYEMQKCLMRAEKIAKEMQTDIQNANLTLMDNFIELSYYIKDVNPNQIAFLNLSNVLKKINIQYNYSENYNIISCDLLLTCYENFLNKKIIKNINIINYDKIAKKLNKYCFSIEKIKTKKYFDNINNNKELFMKLNSQKKYIYDLLINCKNSLKKCLTNIKNILPFPTDNVDINKCLDAISVFPFIYSNNNLTDIVASTGILNI